MSYAQIGLLTLAYIKLAIWKAYTMLPLNPDMFVYVDNIDSVEGLCLAQENKLREAGLAHRRLYTYTLALLAGSEDFFKELAALECGRRNLDFSLMGEQREILIKRFKHPVLIIYHAELDSFSLNFLTHSKFIKGMETIATLYLADIDLIGAERNQYINKEFIHLPRPLFSELVQGGDLKTSFREPYFDGMNYVLSKTLEPEFHNLAAEMTLTMKDSQPFLIEGRFETPSPELEKSPLKITSTKFSKLVNIEYLKAKNSFMLTKTLAKTNVVKKSCCMVF
ncbi:MAG: hypothetical protein ACK42D_04325 [Candidatus Paceibacteria bacterium]